MIGITQLLCGALNRTDAIRYGRHSSRMQASVLRYSEDKKPIVVWNSTRRCNLHCIHCYAEAQDKEYPGGLTTDEAKRMIDDIAEFGAPVLLFSGGEPLVRDDMYLLGKYALERGLRTVISTNGTMITPEAAQKIKEAG